MRFFGACLPRMTDGEQCLRYVKITTARRINSKVKAIRAQSKYRTRVTRVRRDDGCSSGRSAHSQWEAFARADVFALTSVAEVETSVVIGGSVLVSVGTIPGEREVMHNVTCMGEGDLPVGQFSMRMSSMANQAVNWVSFSGTCLTSMSICNHR